MCPCTAPIFVRVCVINTSFLCLLRAVPSPGENERGQCAGSFAPAFFSSACRARAKSTTGRTKGLSRHPPPRAARRCGVLRSTANRNVTRRTRRASRALRSRSVLLFFTSDVFLSIFPFVVCVCVFFLSLGCRLPYGGNDYLCVCVGGVGCRRPPPWSGSSRAETPRAELSPAVCRNCSQLRMAAEETLVWSISC